LKHCYSGFHSTELELVLKSLGVKTVVIAGTMSNYCCGATAREAFWHGYGVLFGSDVTSSDDPDLHEAEIRTLRRGYARIVTSDEVIAEVAALAPAVAAATARSRPRRGRVSRSGRQSSPGAARRPASSCGARTPTRSSSSAATAMPSRFAT
jgi:hypothetical protein